LALLVAAPAENGGAAGQFGCGLILGQLINARTDAAY